MPQGKKGSDVWAQGVLLPTKKWSPSFDTLLAGDTGYVRMPTPSTQLKTYPPYFVLPHSDPSLGLNPQHNNKTPP